MSRMLVLLVLVGAVLTDEQPSPEPSALSSDDPVRCVLGWIQFGRPWGDRAQGSGTPLFAVPQDPALDAQAERLFQAGIRVRNVEGFWWQPMPPGPPKTLICTNGEGTITAAPDRIRLTCDPPGDHAPRQPPGTVPVAPGLGIARDPTTGVLAYLESDGHTLVAFDQGGAIRWRRHCAEGTAAFVRLDVEPGRLETEQMRTRVVPGRFVLVGPLATLRIDALSGEATPEAGSGRQRLDLVPFTVDWGRFLPSCWQFGLDFVPRSRSLRVVPYREDGGWHRYTCLDGQDPTRAWA